MTKVVSNHMFKGFEKKYRKLLVMNAKRLMYVLANIHVLSSLLAPNRFYLPENGYLKNSKLLLSLSYLDFMSIEPLTRIQ